MLWSMRCRAWQTALIAVFIAFLLLMVVVLVTLRARVGLSEARPWHSPVTEKEP